MEAIVDASNETIWATQKAMAELFGVTVPNISYHFKRIFSSGELEPEMVIKEILITAQSGVRGLSEEKVKYYNLDAILSLGYRVNSVQATAFRKWATSILKQYMIKGYAVNQNAVSEQKYNDAIKEVFRLAGINRVVTVLDPTTRREVRMPISECASSHMARRTFCGNLYKRVKDPNIVASMSGHKEGSKAFARYGEIDKDIKRDALKVFEAI